MTALAAASPELQQPCSEQASCTGNRPYKCRQHTLRVVRPSGPRMTATLSLATSSSDLESVIMHGPLARAMLNISVMAPVFACTSAYLQPGPSDKRPLETVGFGKHMISVDAALSPSLDQTNFLGQALTHA